MKRAHKILLIVAVAVAITLAVVIISTAWAEHLEKVKASTEGFFK